MEIIERHLDEQIEFAMTCYDGNEQRQSVADVEDLRLTIYRRSNMAVVVANDHANCSIDETGPETAGDVAYSRPPDGVLGRDQYWAVFLCTINGVPKAFPEKGFIPLIIT